jgi:hypothetical protein
LTLKAKLLLAALAASLLVEPAAALAEDAPPQKKESEAAPRRKRAQPSAPKPVAGKPAEAPDCPRAHYKGDPVCFGAEDAAGLPLPSSAKGASGAAPKRNGDVTVAPKTWLNESAGPDSPTYFNNPNPHPSGNDFGGGLGVDFHF